MLRAETNSIGSLRATVAKVCKRFSHGQEWKTNFDKANANTLAHTCSLAGIGDWIVFVGNMKISFEIEYGKKSVA